MELNRQQMQLKNLNRVSVLNYIRRSKYTTKTALAEDSGLTFMAIQKIVEELISLGLVRQDAYQDGHVGRKAVTYTIDENYGYTVGLYINILKTRAAVMDLHSNVLSIRECDLCATDDDPAVLADKFINMLDAVIEASGVPRARILGVGIGAPGPLSRAEGRIFTPPYFTALRHMPLKKIISDKLGLPVLVHKDANAVTMGEYWHGAGVGRSSMIYVDADMGIGSGFIVDGRLYEGANFMAGELGHIIMDPNGPVCSCGGKGCLDTLASGLRILREFREAVAGRYSGCPDEITISQVLKAGGAKDPTAVAIINDAAHMMGLAISTLINIFDPEVIVIGGILVELYEPYFNIVKETTLLRKFSGRRENDIIPAMLHNLAGVMGAGEMVADLFFGNLVNEVFARSNED
ncbi:MAG: ROK family protein [Clostridiales bacterium]|jgi:predicted NBD/HSP70 family sugar kinase|nr:ROK family protein [Clostridiales bacterium]